MFVPSFCLQAFHRGPYWVLAHHAARKNHMCPNQTILSTLSLQRCCHCIEAYRINSAKPKECFQMAYHSQSLAYGTQPEKTWSKKLLPFSNIFKKTCNRDNVEKRTMVINLSKVGNMIESLEERVHVTSCSLVLKSNITSFLFWVICPVIHNSADSNLCFNYTCITHKKTPTWIV